MVDPLDVEWLRDQIKENVIEYKMINDVGHVGFIANKDMTYFRKEVVPIIKKYAKY